MVAVFMFTNDLRTDDNLTYLKAQQEHKIVLPIIVIRKQPNTRMQSFLEECVKDLNYYLKGTLHIFRNVEEISALQQIYNKFGISQLYYNLDPTYIPMTSVTNWCKAKGIKEVCGQIDHTILDFTKLTRPYKVFSNFYKTFISFALQVKPFKTKQIKTNATGSRGLALEILQTISKFDEYENTRNFFAKPTTRLSVYLNFGCVSMREVCYAFRNNSVLLKELMWREFYAQIAYFYPRLHLGEAFYPQRDVGWKNNIRQFHLWKQGKTGIPLIDASMRCLNTTGYLHNRARMVVASYLVKDLGIDWRLGEAYFKSQLLDYNFASNNGGWQFISGTGASSMMKSRKFSPWIQTKKYDPESIFIKTYMPISFSST